MAILTRQLAAPYASRMISPYFPKTVPVFKKSFSCRRYPSYCLPMFRSLSLIRVAELILLWFLAFAILWKGGKSLETTWLLPLVSCLWVYVSWRTSPRTGASVRPFLWSSVLLFLLWSVLSYIFSLTQNYGLDELLRDISLFLLMLCISRIEWPRFSAERTMRWLAWCAFVAALAGFVVYILQPVNRFVGTFFDFRFQTDYWPNAWAEFVLLAWPSVLWLAVTSSSQTRLIRLGMLGVVLSGLLLSYSRGGMLAFGGQLALLLLLLVIRGWPLHKNLVRGFSRYPWKKIVISAGAVVGMAVVLFVITNLIRSNFYEVQDIESKVTFNAAEGNSSITERSAFWQQAVLLTRERPLLGWGPESFRFVQPLLQRGILATADHPHNVILKLAMERGVPAALLYLCILLAILGVSLRREIFSTDESVLTVRAVLLVSVCGVLAHNMIDYNLQFVGIVLPFTLFLGFLARDIPTHPRESIPRSFQKAVEVVIAIVLLILTVWEGRYLVLSSFGRHAEAVHDDAAALQWFEASKGELFSRDLFLSHAQLLLDQGKSRDAEMVLGRYLAVNGQDYRVWKLLGTVLVARNRPDDALIAYEHAYAYGYQNDLSILRSLLELLEMTGNQDALRVWKPKAEKLLASYANAIEQNTHYISLSTNVEEFEKVTTFLSSHFPDDKHSYDVLLEIVKQHAKDARSKIKARPPGFLW